MRSVRDLEMGVELSRRAGTSFSLIANVIFLLKGQRISSHLTRYEISYLQLRQ